MAAGKFHLYTAGLKHLLQRTIDFENSTIHAYPLHHGYTIGTASHSALAQITDFQASASSTIVNAIACSGMTITASGENTMKYDLADIAGFSSDGDTILVKYVALVDMSASSAGSDKLLIGVFDTDTASTSGVEGTQVNITWPSGGAFKANSNP